MSNSFAVRRFLRLDRAGPGGEDRREGRHAVAWFAVLLALPLAVFGIFSALLIAADYAVTRTHELSVATKEIARLDLVMRHAIETRADAAIANVKTDLNDQDPIGRIRFSTYVNEARFTIVHRDGQRIFPPVSGTNPAEKEMLQRFSAALTAARSELATRTQHNSGKTGFWTADSLGLSFVRCLREPNSLDIGVTFQTAKRYEKSRGLLLGDALTVNAIISDGHQQLVTVLLPGHANLAIRVFEGVANQVHHDGHEPLFIDPDRGIFAFDHQGMSGSIMGFLESHARFDDGTH